MGTISIILLSSPVSLVQSTKYDYPQQKSIYIYIISFDVNSWHIIIFKGQYTQLGNIGVLRLRLHCKAATFCSVTQRNYYTLTVAAAVA